MTHFIVRVQLCCLLFVNAVLLYVAKMHQVSVTMLVKLNWIKCSNDCGDQAAALNLLDCYNLKIYIELQWNLVDTILHNSYIFQPNMFFFSFPADVP